VKLDSSSAVLREIQPRVTSKLKVGVRGLRLTCVERFVIKSETSYSDGSTGRYEIHGFLVEFGGGPIERPLPVTGHTVALLCLRRLTRTHHAASGKDSRFKLIKGISK